MGYGIVIDGDKTHEIINNFHELFSVLTKLNSIDEKSFSITVKKRFGNNTHFHNLYTFVKDRLDFFKNKNVEILKDGNNEVRWILKVYDNENEESLIFYIDIISPDIYSLFVKDIDTKNKSINFKFLMWSDLFEKIKLMLTIPFILFYSENFQNRLVDYQDSYCGHFKEFEISIDYENLNEFKTEFDGNETKIFYYNIDSILNKITEIFNKKVTKVNIQRLQCSKNLVLGKHLYSFVVIYGDYKIEHSFYLFNKNNITISIDTNFYKQLVEATPFGSNIVKENIGNICIKLIFSLENTLKEIKIINYQRNLYEELTLYIK